MSGVGNERPMEVGSGQVLSGSGQDWLEPIRNRSGVVMISREWSGMARIWSGQVRADRDPA